jgi:hypothetical protein
MVKKSGEISLLTGMAWWFITVVIVKRQMSLCLKVRIKFSSCLKVIRNGIQVSQDSGVSISRVPGLWAVPGLRTAAMNTGGPRVNSLQCLSICWSTNSASPEQQR